MELREILDSILTDGRVFAAILGFYGVLFVAIYNSFDRRKSARNERRDRRDDFQKAIYAEISSFLANLEHDDLESYKQKMTARIVEEDFKPFIPIKKHSHVFHALLPEIYILPLETIDAVTFFYYSISSIEALANDMRSEDYAKLNPQRRAAIFEDYITIQQTAILQGRRAIHLIHVYSKGGPDAVKEEKMQMRARKAIQNKQEVKEWLDAHKT